MRIEKDDKWDLKELGVIKLFLRGNL